MRTTPLRRVQRTARGKIGHPPKIGVTKTPRLVGIKDYEKYFWLSPDLDAAASCPAASAACLRVMRLNDRFEQRPWNFIHNHFHPNEANSCN
ncbi:hypothetical protein ACFFJT_21120 [Dyella flava]|uniref:Uncharacterized protein n=1 Tax=Dyella flava TaxID=1920170 RepID=A0ABS2K1C1_9GAMM|nr:hypothetical protein [Dyella flava]MBM7124558.1 hypothetical protein [Dyella flava]